MRTHIGIPKASTAMVQTRPPFCRRSMTGAVSSLKCCVEHLLTSDHIAPPRQDEQAWHEHWGLLWVSYCAWNYVTGDTTCHSGGCTSCCHSGLLILDAQLLSLVCWYWMHELLSLWSGDPGHGMHSQHLPTAVLCCMMPECSHMFSRFTSRGLDQVARFEIKMQNLNCHIELW